MFANINNNRNFADLFFAVNSRDTTKINRAFEDFDQKYINDRPFDKSLLDLAIHKKLPEVIDRLLKVKGLDINSGDSKQVTVLAFACYVNDPITVKKILQQFPRVDINKANTAGDTPLLLAAHKESLDMVSALLERSDLDLSVLDRQSTLGGTLREYLQKNPSAQSKAILSCIELEMERRSTQDKEMHEASGSTTNQKSLSSKSVEDTAHIDAVKNAFFSDDHETIHALLDTSKIKDINQLYGSSPLLHLSIEFDQPEITTKLLGDESLNVNQKDLYGLTALNMACFRGDTEIVEQLLSHAMIQPGVTDDEGSSPLRAACISKNWHLIPQLISKLDRDDIDPQCVVNGLTLEAELRKMQSDGRCAGIDIEKIIDKLYSIRSGELQSTEIDMDFYLPDGLLTNPDSVDEQHTVFKGDETTLANLQDQLKISEVDKNIDLANDQAGCDAKFFAQGTQKPTTHTEATHEPDLKDEVYQVVGTRP